MAREAQKTSKQPQQPPEREDHFSHTKTIVKAAGIFFVAVVFSKLANYAFRWVGSRLGPSDYGVFSLAYAVFDVFCLVSLFGVDQAVGRFLPEERALGRKEGSYNVVWFAIKLALITSVLSAVLLFFGAPLLSEFFHEPRLSASLWALAPAIPLSVLCVVLVTSARSLKHAEYEAASKYFTESFFRPILAYAAVVLGLGAFGVSAAVSFSAAFAFLVAAYFVAKLLPGDWYSGIRSARSPEGFKRLALSLYVSVISGLVVTWGSVFAVGKLLSVREVGILNAAIPVATFVQIPAIAVPILFGTVAIELHALKNRAAVERVYKNVTKAIMLFTLPIALLIVAFSSQVLTVLFGPDYAAGANALSVMALGYLVFAMGQTALSMLVVLKRPKIFSAVFVVSAVIFIAGLYFLIPIRAFFGAASANALALAAEGLIPLAAVFWISKMHPFSGTFARTVLAAILAGAFAFASQFVFPLSPLLAIALGGIVYLVFYGVLLFLFRGFDADDLELFKLVEKRTGLNLGNARRLLRNYYLRR